MCYSFGGGLGVNSKLEDAEFLQFLKMQGDRARYVTSVCTGSLLLAAAGLLQGYRATTHWLSMELLAMFGVETVAQRVVIDRNQITGGGITAGIDFGLVLASELFGDTVAQEIQLWMEYNLAPPFTSGSLQTASPLIKAGRVSPLPKSKFGSIELIPAARRAAFSNICEVLFLRAIIYTLQSLGLIFFTLKNFRID